MSKPKFNDKQLYSKDKHSIKGLVSCIYYGQKQSSIERGHKLPEYTKTQLGNWMVQQPNFLKLYSDWQQSDYQSRYKPSVDRINDLEGYNFNNIRLITWEENNKLSPRKKHNPNTSSINSIRKNRPKRLPAKTVIQLTVDGEFIRSWPSAAIAATAIPSVIRTGINHVCAGRQNTCGGFKWRYTS